VSAVATEGGSPIHRRSQTAATAVALVIPT